MTPTGIEQATFWFVAQYLNHCANSAPYKLIYILLIRARGGADGWGTGLKPEGREFDPRLLLEFFIWHIPSGRTMALGLTQPLTEISTRNIAWGVKAASV